MRVREGQARSTPFTGSLRPRFVTRWMRMGGSERRAGCFGRGVGKIDGDKPVARLSQFAIPPL